MLTIDTFLAPPFLRGVRGDLGVASSLGNGNKDTLRLNLIMRFKTQRPSSSIPTIDLIPMLNVMMGVLAFFVMTSMMLSTEQGVNVQLPSSDTDTTQPENTVAPLVAQFNTQGQILLNNQPINKEQLFEQMQVYLTQNPKGVVFLQADSKMPYEQVMQILGEMRDVGGDRVSLAIEQ